MDRAVFTVEGDEIPYGLSFRQGSSNTPGRWQTVFYRTRFFIISWRVREKMPDVRKFRLTLKKEVV